MAYDPTVYRAAEHAGYEAVAADYDRWLARCTGAFAEPLLDRLALQPGQSLLDAACGPGTVALAALPRVRPGGSVRGVDFSGAMVARARAHGDGEPGLDFAEMDIERLALPDASFDAATFAFGLMHVPDPDAALAELRRVLKPGGRLALSVWAPLERVTFMKLILDAVKRIAPDAGFPPGPPMFGFGTPEALAPRFARAGFAPPVVDEVAVTLTFPDFASYWNALVHGAARLGGVVRMLPAPVRTALELRVQTDLAAFAAGRGGYAIPAAACLAVATRA